MDIKRYFDNMRVRTFSLNGSIVDVRELYEERGKLGFLSKVLYDLYGVELPVSDEVEGRVVLKHIVRELYVNNWELPVLADSVEYAKKFVNSPEWSFLRREVEVIEGVEKVVGLNREVVPGKKEKGYKQRMAKEIFVSRVLCDEPISYKEFVNALIKELGMTMMGANTYLYNLKKEYGLVRSKV
jgi:hypothetical protein